MRIENFVPGIVSEPGKIPRASTAAADSVNLRADKDGFLRARLNVQAVINSAQNIHGIVVVKDMIFYTVDGALYVVTDPDAGEGVAVSGVADLAGRLSVVDRFDNFFILTSEGEDVGWLVNIEDRSDITATLLSLPVPDSVAFDQNTSVANSPPPGYGKYFYYKFVFYRVDPLIGDMRSAASDTYTGTPLIKQDANSETVWGITVSFPDWTNDAIHFCDVYRSDGYDHETAAPANFRFIKRLTSNDPSFKDTVSETNRGDNEKLADQKGFGQFPQQATSLAYYNGLVFATCGDELRYCNFNYGNIQYWNWPENNSIKRPYVDYAIEYGGLLLFGGRSASYQIQGASPADWRVRHVSGTGALNTYCAALLTSGMAVLSDDGMYLSDGTSFEKISDALDEFFKSDPISDGAVVQLPSNDVLWSLTTLGEADRQFLMNLDRRLGFTWESWSGASAHQFGKRIVLGLIGIRASDGGWSDSGGDGWGFYDTEHSQEEVMASIIEGDLSRVVWADADSVDRDMVWHWLSQDMFNREAGLAMDRKLFRRLEVAGESDNAVEFEFTVKGDEDMVVRQTVEQLSKGKAIKVPIRRRGESMVFKVSGSGRVVLRGFNLNFEVVRTLR